MVRLFLLLAFNQESSIKLINEKVHFYFIIFVIKAL